MLYPLTFQPIFKERVWGGRELERLYHKPLPPGVPIGESWEISDRPGDVSVIANGPLAGKDLRWLMEHHAADLLGEAERRKRAVSLAHQDPGRAGQALASSPSPAGQGSRTRRRTQDRDVVRRRGRAGRGALCRPETRRHPRRIRAEDQGRHGGRVFSSRERAERATPCSCPAGGFTRSARGWSSLKSSRTRTRPTGCSIGTASAWTANPANCISRNPWPALTSTTSSRRCSRGLRPTGRAQGAAARARSAVHRRGA